MPKVNEKKAKLRPARDVISRLRWSPLADGNQVVFGYVDRINGTMEKAVEDYVPASDGGDIPEHRILYFRRVVDVDDDITTDDLSNGIIWDRAGRVDRVFDSGYCDREISDETVEEARAAIGNMARLEEEKAERRKQKARARARRARTRKVASPAVAEHNADGTVEISESRNRFQWRRIPWHHFDECSQRWVRGDDGHSSDGCTNPNKCESLTVLTWNVLSNIHAGVDTDENGLGGHESRWSLLAKAIRQQCPDIIALQEAVPDFADQILAVDWVKADYASSISPVDKSSVDPIGNIFLWKKSHVEAGGLHACVDGIRWRVISATFWFGPDRKKALVCANVHLPSDKPGVVKAEDRVSRQDARRRELSSIIVHLQTIESYLRRVKDRAEINHLVVGDFNCSALELENGALAGGGGYFQDVWSEIKGVPGENFGCTFDPMGNPRAAKSSSSPSSRRIDRLYLSVDAELEPVQADVIHGKTDADDLPPSDHYGICARFLLRGSKPRSLYDPSKHRNAWAANAPSSKDSMLAIILDSEEMEQIKGIYDQDSSLLAPHITLLYGFVGLHHGSLDLATQAIRDSIKDAFQEQSTSARSIFFTGESLDVFEHRSSTTLVARPNDVDCRGNQWLMQLYSSLRSRFRCCNDQEMHTTEGFIPHVSLGKFGFTSSARKAAAEYMDAMSTLNIPVHSIDVLERSQNGKFRSIASVPFSSPPNYPSKGSRHIIQDTGSAASSDFSEKSRMVLSILNRASRSASRSFENIQITSDIVPYGSVALDSALPKMSDLDVVVMLTNDEIDPPSQFLALANEECAYLKKLMTCLRETHDVSKMRLRRIRSGLNVLSIQIQQNLPSADIILCLLGHDGKPVDNERDGAFDSIQDNGYLMKVLADIEVDTKGANNSISAKDLFCASLRLIKLWAYNRGVYGAKFGFLGGGSWAIFLAYVMKSKGGKEAISGATSMSEAAHRLTLAFFCEASRWPWPKPVALRSEGIESQALLHPRLVVLSPSSATNLAKNSTVSTCLVTAAELRRASTLAKGIIQNDTKSAFIGTLQSVISPLRLQELIASSPEIIALELLYDKEGSLPSQHLPDDIEAWG